MNAFLSTRGLKLALETSSYAFLESRHYEFGEVLANNVLAPGLYGYINPKNCRWFLNNRNHRIFYRVDGQYARFILNLLVPLGSGRRPPQAFDFSSMAPAAFDCFAKSGLSIGVVGAEGEELRRFCKIVSERFQDLNLLPICDGYESKEAILSAIKDRPACDIYLLSCGSLKQEQLGLRILQAHNKPVFTCGAFVGQTARSGGQRYYPGWIQRSNLRWAYRFIQEPHVIYRVGRYYPRFLIDVIRVYFGHQR